MTGNSSSGYGQTYWNPQAPRPGGPSASFPPPPAPQPSSALAILAFITSIIAFMTGWVPFLGLGLGLLGLLLSVLAVRKQHLRGLSVAGIVMSTLATLTSLVTTGLLLLAMFSDSSSSTRTQAAETYSASDFVEVDERELSGIARDPDAHEGKTLIVYGHITQFDANTGPCEMRVSISATKQSQQYDYEHNSLAYSGDGESECPDLSDVVQDDEVKLSVVIEGGKSYSSIGGRTNVPYLQIVEVEVL